MGHEHLAQCKTESTSCWRKPNVIKLLLGAQIASWRTNFRDNGCHGWGEHVTDEQYASNRKSDSPEGGVRAKILLVAAAEDGEHAHARHKEEGAGSKESPAP
jgi:hypothetical protein